MYAIGSKALGICDRCGFTYKLKELKYEVQNKTNTGLKVCYECFDPDQPQYNINSVTTLDVQSLYDPRVDTGEADSRRLGSFNPVGGGNTQVGSVTLGLDITGEIGTIKVSIT
tara:strand:+ start:2424 stop:2762 length:339 start_codon:yes stop_codon:yes gene_type:complete